MTDLDRLLKESVDAAYERRPAAAPEVKRQVLRRGRRRRAGRIAASVAVVVAVAGAAPAATRALLLDEPREVAARPVPEVGAELVRDVGGAMATDGRSLWFGNGRKEGDGGRRNSIARLDLATGEITDGPVSVASPHDIEWSPSGLWSVSWHGDMPVGGEGHPVDGVIEHVATESLERTAFIEREDSAPYDIAIGAAGDREVVWVADMGRDELLEIDSETMDIVTVHDAPARVNAVFTSGPYVYVLSSRDHVIVRLDTVTSETVEFEVPACANEMEIAAGSLWVADYCGDALHRIDESSGEIVATMPVGEAPTTVEFAEGLVWVAAQGQVVRVDPAANAVAGDPIRVPELYAQDLLYAGGSMWVSSHGAVYRLDEEVPAATPPPTETPAPAPPATPDPVGEVPEGVRAVGVPHDPRALATGGGSLWTGLWTIQKMDPVSGGVLGEVDAGGLVEDLDFDEEEGILWALVEVAEEERGAVVAVDPGLMEVVFGPVYLEAGAAPGRELEARGGTAWVAGTGPIVRSVELDGEHVEHGFGDDFQVDLHLAATREAMFVIGTNGTVFRVDAETYEREQVADLRGHVVTAAGSDEFAWVLQQTTEGETLLWRLDGRTGEVSEEVDLGPALGFPYLAEHDGLVWVAQQRGRQEVTVTSIAYPNELESWNLRVATSDIAAGPEGAWLSTGREMLYEIAPP